MTRPSTIIFVIAILSSTILLAPFHAEVIIGTEVTRIAASIAGGRGFSSPFSQPTGPSAWIPPVYANRCLFARNDEELICVSLEAKR